VAKNSVSCVSFKGDRRLKIYHQARSYFCLCGIYDSDRGLIGPRSCPALCSVPHVLFVGVAGIELELQLVQLSLWSVLLLLLLLCCSPGRSPGAEYPCMSGHTLNDGSIRRSMDMERIYSLAAHVVCLYLYFLLYHRPNDQRDLDLRRCLAPQILFGVPGLLFLYLKNMTKVVVYFSWRFFLDP
jgi:hypothetical protein